MNHLVSSVLLATTTAIAGVAAFVTTPATTTTPLTPVVQESTSPAACVETDTVSAIFAPETDQKIIEMVSRKIHQIGNERFSPRNRWPGPDNTPVTITYSFPSDGVIVPNAIFGGSAPNELHAELTSQFGSEALWKSKFAQVFQEWSDITGNIYIEVADDDAPMGSSGPLHGGSDRGDVRITAINIDGGSGVLAYNFFPGAGGGGDMVIDSADFWAVPSNDYRFFRNMVSHEHGHGAGLEHVCPANGTKLMEPFLNTGFDGLQHDDIRGATHFYGDFFEPNENSASAGHLGDFFTPGSEPFSGLVNMAMRDASDVDFYSFYVDGPGSVDVTLSIVGEVYDNSSQNNDGSCDSGNIFDSTALNDPELAVLDVNGTSVLASVDDNGFGGDESLNGVILPDAGTYYIRVRSVEYAGFAQIYDLNGSVTIDEIVVGCVADLNGDGVVDTADLGILLGAFGGGGPVGDLNDDGTVDTADLGILLGVFGTCTLL